MKKLERILSLGLFLISILPLTANAVTFGYYGQLDGALGLACLGKDQKIAWNNSNTALEKDIFVNSNAIKAAAAFGMQMGIATQISQKTSFELGIEINQNTGYQSNGKIYGSEEKPTNHLYDYKYKVFLFRGMAVGRAFYQITPKVSPFLSFGAGLGRVTTRDFQTTYTSNSIKKNYHRNFDNHVSNNFAWQLGTGINYKLTDHASTILGYRYVDFGNIETPDINNSTKKLRTGKIGIHEIYLGIHITINKI